MTWTIVLLCFSVILGSCAARDEQHVPEPPTWPQKYEVNFTFAVPYVKRYQKDGLVYQYRIWQDTEQGHQRMERGTAAIPDLETVIEDENQNKMWTLFVHKTRRECKVEPLDGGSGPTLSHNSHPKAPARDVAAAASVPKETAAASAAVSQARKLKQWSRKPALTYVLPEVTRERWKYDGERQEGSQTVHAWIFKSQPGHMGWGHYTSNYTLTVTPDGVPKKLDVWGINPYTGGHFDHYIATYSGFQPGDIDASVFEPPHLCKDRTLSHKGAEGARGARGLLPGDLRTDMLAWLPPTYHGDAQYDDHVQAYGKRHRSHSEYLTRRQIFHQNARFVKEWNEGQEPHQDAHLLELNHWSDMSASEYGAHLEGNRRQRREWAAKGSKAQVHQPSLAEHMLPSTVDWRGTLADSPVKNQAACGSCWAFGAVGALETAYYRSTGQQRLFSEQNLVDCSWDIPDGDLSNQGCYDGYQQIAFEYVWRTGGIATEADYPYIGVSGFCNTTTPLTKLSNGKTMYVKGGEVGLMEALVTKGPMTVAVDAGHESFRFYKSGIYNNTACTVKPVTDLDHAVLVSGYGENDGSKFWIVKNTWSSHWGENGYVRMARKPADCGIATEPLYVEFEVEN